MSQVAVYAAGVVLSKDSVGRIHALVSPRPGPALCGAQVTDVLRQPLFIPSDPRACDVCRRSATKEGRS